MSVLVATIKGTAAYLYRVSPQETQESFAGSTPADYGEVVFRFGSPQEMERLFVGSTLKTRKFSVGLLSEEGITKGGA